MRRLNDTSAQCEIMQFEMAEKTRAPRNRTIDLDRDELRTYSMRSTKLERPSNESELVNRVINQNVFEVMTYLPDAFADLLFIDPPYNLTKSFNSTQFARRSDDEYAEWFVSWFPPLLRVLKPNATVYICSDWQTSAVIFPIVNKHLIVRNRITWEREKGRGAKTNWKNASEDILFCTNSGDYVFNTEPVKLKRRVLAPYKHENGNPKDWEIENDGNYRLTHPSNLWTDMTVPFWSMPENTDHPTQKPEKLLAKLVLASTVSNAIVFDPFLGSGTSAVVAKKLGRRFVGVEIDEFYCALALKRLDLAELAPDIQGYSGGVFWERNTANDRTTGIPRQSGRQSAFPLG